MAETPATVVIAVDDETEVILGQIEAPHATLALVDALMRLVVMARRRGWEIRLRYVSEELRGLLELAGLDGVLALESFRQAEGREELRVDEVVEPGDPPV
jgi:hypothetical protein